MISVLRTVCSSDHFYLQEPIRNRVLEQRHTKEEDILDPLKLTVP